MMIWYSISTYNTSSQLWFRWLPSTRRQQSITWTNVDLDNHMTSLCHNDLIHVLYIGQQHQAHIYVYIYIHTYIYTYIYICMHTPYIYVTSSISMFSIIFRPTRMMMLQLSQLSVTRPTRLVRVGRGHPWCWRGKLYGLWNTVKPLTSSHPKCCVKVASQKGWPLMRGGHCAIIGTHVLVCVGRYAWFCVMKWKYAGICWYACAISQMKFMCDKSVTYFVWKCLNC